MRLLSAGSRNQARGGTNTRPEQSLLAKGTGNGDRVLLILQGSGSYFISLDIEWMISFLSTDLNSSNFIPTIVFSSTAGTARGLQKEGT